MIPELDIGQLALVLTWN